MNKQTKITLGVLIGMLLVILIVLAIGVIRKNKLEEEYERYKYTIDGITDNMESENDYQKIIEFCVKNGLGTSIHANDTNDMTVVPDFIEELNVDIYYVATLEYETVYIAVIDGEIVSNLEEVKRYFE